MTCNLYRDSLSNMIGNVGEARHEQVGTGSKRIAAPASAGGAAPAAWSGTGRRRAAGQRDAHNDLDVTKTHSRPHVSDDNPYSEVQFKTLKYRPDFPARFGSIEERAGALPDIFSLVQHRTPSFGHRTHAARHGALWHRSSR